PDPFVATNAVDLNIALGRAYLDAVYDVTPSVKIEGGLFGTYLSGGTLNVARLDPRLALAWTPMDGHWLRIGFLRETSAANSTTLAPIGMLGLQSNAVSLAIGGYSDTLAARWDAQWTDWLFTEVDYQHQQLSDLSIPIPLAAETIDLSKGRIDRFSATANVWLTHGIGAFATLAYADSKDQDPSSSGFGGGLPYVPETAARIGLTYVNPVNLKVTAAATYVGPREGDQFRTELAGYWTADASLI
ncbi:TonB-dependent receptor, partial [Rhizobiaceae sp. 2RAB30]